MEDCIDIEKSDRCAGTEDVLPGTLCPRSDRFWHWDCHFIQIRVELENARILDIDVRNGYAVPRVDDILTLYVEPASDHVYGVYNRTQDLLYRYEPRLELKRAEIFCDELRVTLESNGTKYVFHATGDLRNAATVLDALLRELKV